MNPVIVVLLAVIVIVGWFGFCGCIVGVPCAFSVMVLFIWMFSVYVPVSAIIVSPGWASSMASCIVV